MLHDSGRAKGLVAQFVSLSVWQSGLVVQKVLVAASDFQSVMLLQLGVAALVMLPILFFIEGLPKPTGRNALNLVWGLMAPGLVFVFAIAGAARTDGVSVAMIWGTFPLAGTIIARLLIGERMHWSFLAGGASSFLFLSCLAISRAEAGTGDMIGNFLVALSVVCASVNMSIGRVLNRQPSSWFRIATLQVTGAALGAAAITLVLGFDPPDLGQRGNLAAIAYLVIFMTITNFLAYNIALSRVPVPVIALNGSFAPLIGLFSAWVILGSRLRPLDLVFAALLMASVAFPYVLQIMRRRMSRTASANDGRSVE